MIYLDNAATTFPKPEEVYRAMDRVNRELAVNAGRGSYRAAREADAIISDVRSRLLRLFNAEGVAETVLTPGITAALNQILNGLRLGGNSVVYITPYEHNAVARTITRLQEEKKFRLVQIPLCDDCSVDIKKMEYMFSVDNPTAVISIAVSNVTGYIIPYAEMFRAAKKYGAVTVLDAAQAAGLVKLDMKTEDIDILAFAGHKTLCGPFGIGGFVIKNNVTLDVSFTGGTGSNSLVTSMPQRSPDKYEAGSKDIVAIAGLQAALKVIDVDGHYKRVKELTDYLYGKLSELGNVTVYGTGENIENIGIASISVEGYTSDEAGQILDNEYDIAVRTGYHCAPFIHDYLGDRESAGTVRIGIGQFNTEEEIDTLIDALGDL